jgi:predicted HAD superfamily hydrolase
LIKLEIEIELNSVYPIYKTLSEIAKLRKQGARIIFITDNYLFKEVIREMLLKVGAFSQNDEIYVSGEIRLTKLWGGLFNYVLAKEGLKPGEIIHYGDNMYSDGFVPARIGLHIYGMSSNQEKYFYKRQSKYKIIQFILKLIKRYYLK